jgi:hypothetical protein
MHILLKLTICALTSLICTNKRIPKDEINSVPEPTPIQTEHVFKEIIGLPPIKDKAIFMEKLKGFCNFEIDTMSSFREMEKVTTYEKVKIYGSDKDFYLVEYDYGDGCMAAFPWKYQVLFTTKGELVKILDVSRFELVEIFPKEPPFLLTVVATTNGNGVHEIFKMTADTLQNILQCEVRTYDSHEDRSVYEPNELRFTKKDFNKDGINDIAFKGKLVMLMKQTKDGIWYDGDNPAEKIPIEFIFLYDKQSGRFKEKEDYVKKYHFDY